MLSQHKPMDLLPMNIRFLSVFSAIALALTGCVNTPEPTDSGIAPARVQAQVQPSAQAARTTPSHMDTDVGKVLAETDSSLEMARGGGYGRLKPGDLERLENAHENIKTLLDGHTSTSELSPQDRVALSNAQTLIASILRKDDKNRMICRPVAQTGSRLRTASECLTVGQREERAKGAREGIDKAQNTFCVPTPDHPCGN